MKQLYMSETVDLSKINWKIKAKKSKLIETAKEKC